MCLQNLCSCHLFFVYRLRIALTGLAGKSQALVSHTTRRSCEEKRTTRAQLIKIQRSYIKLTQNAKRDNDIRSKRDNNHKFSDTVAHKQATKKANFTQ